MSSVQSVVPFSFRQLVSIRPPQIRGFPPKIFLVSRRRDQDKRLNVPAFAQGYGGQARIHKKKDQVSIMKITRNAEEIKQKETKLTKVFQFSRTFSPFALCAFLFALFSVTALAQNVNSIADREVQRRQAAIPAGEAALARGQSALRSRNYTVAYQEFKTAVSYLPDAVVSGRAHDEAAQGVCKSGTVLAEARIAQGDYAGAEAILSEILNRYDPNCRKAQELIANMHSPVTSTKPWTPSSSIKSRK